MFKRAIISNEISGDFIHTADIAIRFGLNGVELRSAWGKNPHELNTAEIQMIKNVVNSTGLEIPCINAPVFKCKLGVQADYQEHLEILQCCIAVARELGVSMIRGFTFWDEGSFEECLPEITTKIKAVESILKENRLMLVIESDSATSANSGQKLEQILDRVSSDWIKALWNPGNNSVNGRERPYPDEYERLKHLIAHIHVKDLIRDPVTGALQACPIGKREVGFPAIFKRLAMDGYSGWLSLEPHVQKQGPFYDELPSLPKASAFYLGGEEALLENLEMWNEMLHLEGLYP